MGEREGQEIKSIRASTKKNKRFQVILENGDKYHFGLLNPIHGTYIDNGDKNLRYRYWARHYGNARERELIDSLSPSPSMYSAYILWGDHTDIKKNIKALNRLIRRGCTRHCIGF
jgi:hypothetical protein